MKLNPLPGNLGIKVSLNSYNHQLLYRKEQFEHSTLNIFFCDPCQKTKGPAGFEIHECGLPVPLRYRS